MPTDLLTPIVHLLEEDAACGTPSGLLLAMSGGVDSSVLLDLLVQACALTDRELAVAHVDHRLRPDSGQDAAFCLQVASAHGLPCFVEAITLSPGGSIQDKARRGRYAALAAVARQIGVNTIVTAHHGDDALETALFNLARGSSLDGLVSLRTRGAFPLGDPDLRMLRPLLSATRAEIEAYAAARNLAFRTDPTNLEDKYARNRLRHHVVPALTAERGPSPAIKTLENLRQDAQALNVYASLLLESSQLPEPNAQAVALDREVLRPAPSAVVARVLKSIHHPWSEPTLAEALALIASATPLSRLAIPGALFILSPERVVIEPVTGRGKGDLDERIAHPARITFESPGKVPFFDGVLTWTLRDSILTDTHPVETVDLARFDLDELRTILGADQGAGQGAVPALSLRGYRKGDRIRLEGMVGRKKVADLLQEGDVAPDTRWRWPCLCIQPRQAATGEEVLLWVIGLRRAALAPVTLETTRVVEFRWTPSLPAK